MTSVLINLVTGGGGGGGGGGLGGTGERKWGRESVGGVASHYGLDGPGVKSR